MSRPIGTLSRSLLALSVALLMISPIYAPTWTVCSSGCDYTSIQDAVDGAVSGDVLELGAETFVENVSIIEKDLRIQGAGPEHTVIDGDAVGSVFSMDLNGWRAGTCCGPPITAA